MLTMMVSSSAHVRAVAGVENAVRRRRVPLRRRAALKRPTIERSSGAAMAVADVPGRHEPGTGEINYEHIFGLLREQNYRGYVGLEYSPRVDAEASLRAVRAMAS